MAGFLHNFILETGIITYTGFLPLPWTWIRLVQYKMVNELQWWKHEKSRFDITILETWATMVHSYNSFIVYQLVLQVGSKTICSFFYIKIDANCVYPGSLCTEKHYIAKCFALDVAWNSIALILWRSCFAGCCLQAILCLSAFLGNNCLSLVLQALKRNVQSRGNLSESKVPYLSCNNL